MINAVAITGALHARLARFKQQWNTNVDMTGKAHKKGVINATKDSGMMTSRNVQ